MKIIFLTLAFIIPSAFIAQVQTNGGSVSTLGDTNYFLDASLYEGFATSTGKLLGFPRVNLTQFQFNTGIAADEVILSYFDGAVVYNSGTGNSAAAVDGNNGIVTAVTPGFYYFSNPSGAVNGNVTAGVWTPLGGGSASKEVTTTESTAAIKVNGAQVYSITGTFTASGSSTAVTVTKPAGMTGYYSMVTYKDGKTFRSTVYSFDITLTDGNVITGNGAFSEVYPAGTYSYVLEYFK